jgi:hypothetical protein
MNIIKSDIVSPAYDVLWDDTTDVIKGATPRDILILVNTFSPDNSESGQLQKMLEACKLSPEQYNIIQLDKGKMVAWHQLRELLDPKIIFMIGILPSQLGISSLFRLNAPNRFNDRVWLPTVSLSELEQNKALKQQLWNEGMKPLFIDAPVFKTRD